MRFVRVSRAVPLAYLKKSLLFSPGTAVEMLGSPIAPITATRRSREMMHTLYGILILRIPLQPWDHIAFALPKKRHHQTTAPRAIVQSCLHLQRCVITVRIISTLCAVVCCSSG